MTRPPFTESNLHVGDWIKYKAPTGGALWIAEILSFYPFGNEPMADTTLGRVKLSAIVEVRRLGRQGCTPADHATLSSSPARSGSG